LCFRPPPLTGGKSAILRFGRFFIKMEPALGETSRKTFFMLGCAFGAAGMRVCQTATKPGRVISR